MTHHPRKDHHVTRNRLLPAAVLLTVGLVGPAGIATAEDQPAAPTTASASPSAAATAAGQSQATGTQASGPSPAAPSGAAPGAASSSAAASPAASPTANQPPVARADAVTVVAGRAVTFDPLANDADPDQQPAALSLVGITPTDSRLTRTGSSVTFSARSTDRGTTTFTYTVTDGQDTASAQITVTVTAPPPPPRTVTITTARSLVTLHTYAIHGSVAPRSPGPVDVAVQRLSGGSWVGYKTDRTDASGAYTVSFRPNVPRSFTFRAVATWGDGKHVTSGRLTGRWWPGRRCGSPDP